MRLLRIKTEIPPFTLEHMATPAEHIPGGFEGMGEAGVIGGGAAIARAVEDALSEYGVGIFASLAGHGCTPCPLMAFGGGFSARSRRLRRLEQRVH